MPPRETFTNTQIEISYKFIPGPDPSLFFSSTYVELCRTSTCCGREFFRAWVKTRNSFPAHHGGRRLWRLPSPMARRHLNQTHRRHPHTMGDAACAWFGLNPPGGRVVSTPPPNAIMSFFYACTLLIISLNISIYLTLY